MIIITSSSVALFLPAGVLGGCNSDEYTLAASPCAVLSKVIDLYMVCVCVVKPTLIWFVESVQMA